MTGSKAKLKRDTRSSPALPQNHSDSRYYLPRASAMGSVSALFKFPSSRLLALAPHPGLETNLST